MNSHPSSPRRRLLAVAIALPAVLLATTGQGAATATSLPGTRTTDLAAPITGNLTTKGLTTGTRPHVAFLRGARVGTAAERWRLVRPNGTRLALPATYTAFAPLGRGIIGLSVRRHTIGTQVTGTGRVVRRDVVRGYRLASSADGSIVGWLGGKGYPRVFEAGGGRTFRMPRVAKGASIAAINGSGTCKEQAPEGGGCAVYVNSANQTGAWVSTSHGLVDTAGPMRSVADVAPNGRIIGLKRLFDGGSCSGLWTPTGHLSWKTCTVMPESFSPRPRRILAGPAYADGFGAGQLAVLDAQGHRLLDYRRVNDRSATVMGSVWEDNTHVLAVLFQHGTWSIVRYGVDGSKEFAVPPVKAGAFRDPFLLPTR